MNAIKAVGPDVRAESACVHGRAHGGCHRRERCGGQKAKGPLLDVGDGLLVCQRHRSPDSTGPRVMDGGVVSPNDGAVGHRHDRHVAVQPGAEPQQPVHALETPAALAAAALAMRVADGPQSVSRHASSVHDGLGRGLALP